MRGGGNTEDKGGVGDGLYGVLGRQIMQGEIMSCMHAGTICDGHGL